MFNRSDLRGALKIGVLIASLAAFGCGGSDDDFTINNGNNFAPLPQPTTQPPGAGDNYRSSTFQTNVMQFNPQGNYTGANPTTFNVLQQALVIDNGANNSIQIIYSGAGGQQFILSVVSNGANLAERTYDLLDNGNIGSLVNLVEVDAATQSATATWTSSPVTSGTGVVNVIDLDLPAGRLELDYNFTNVQPNPENGGTANGSFDVQGQIVVTNLQRF